VSFLEQLATKLGIRSKEDWYRVSNAQVDNAGGTTLRNKLAEVLMRAYPDYPWDPILFSNKSKASKQFLVLRFLEKSLSGYGKLTGLTETFALFLTVSGFRNSGGIWPSSFTCPILIATLLEFGFVYSSPSHRN